jgi:hypothetical protein
MVLAKRENYSLQAILGASRVARVGHGLCLFVGIETRRIGKIAKGAELSKGGM